MKLIDRCEIFMDALGVPTTSFCKRINLSPSGFYRWKSGSVKLSDVTLERIDRYLTQYGF